ncbi:Sphingosine-1-phosphate lyase 1 (S1PL) (SP-lyase 1) (SPL) (SPL 1) (Sphingosine-1-phosphate aldolase) [Durusdinium trenchii]|uniref:sphinganine-1-phosphate aldolase n=1 Tax=Durusdinium trenchii TaxID=1381693 RepID=A0ABP0J6W1_9DINO
MVLAMERPLKNAVNKFFRGKEPYQVLRSLALFLVAAKFISRLQQIIRHQGLRSYLLRCLTPYLKKLPMVRAKLDKEMKKTMSELRAKFSQELTSPCTSLPSKGMEPEELLKLLDRRKELDTKTWAEGKITGAVYHGGKQHYDFVGQVFSRWAFCNPLHPELHPALRQMDAEVVQMVVNMYHGGPDACGAFTTGGTESILMAMKAHRDWGEAEKGITEPNIVVCTTAHAAFDKAGKYFKIHVRKAKTDKDMAIDLNHMKHLIDSNTVAIVGSCCQYAHGTIDPIEEMGKIAKKKKIGLHVDCCLGGFLVPFMEKAGFSMPGFDFRVPGVTSISCDPHKYGFAPKGSSVVMFSNKELRRHMYCYLTDWSGGIYATPTMTGSRPGGPVAATWAAMCRYGEDGYVETTRQIVGATRQIAEGLKQIPELRLVGRPEVCVVAFDTKPTAGFSCYALADCLKQQSGWEVATCQNPPSVHLALTLLTSKQADRFIKDVKAAVDLVKESPKLYNSTAGVYGMAATLPAGFIEEAVGAYMDAMSEVHDGPAGP